MDKKSLDELLNTLSFIAMHKSMLPFSLRGWVNALGLYVQERRAGQWTRLQAGGSFRSYLDAWCEEEGDWQVRKFDQETWKRRFSHVLLPTINIADYLLTHVTESGELVSEKSAILNEAINHYKATQEWLWLPGVAADLDEVSKQMVQLEPRKLSEVISYAERLRRDSKNPLDWQFLAMLYDLAGRYKDMENATKSAYELVCSEFRGSEWMAWRWHQTLGMLYFAAFSNSRHGHEVLVLGSFPSRVTTETLGYTAEEVRTLAKENLSSSLVEAKHAGGPRQDSSELKELELAIAACENQ